MVKSIYNLRYFGMKVAEIKDAFDHSFEFFLPAVAVSTTKLRPRFGEMAGNLVMKPSISLPRLILGVASYVILACAGAHSSGGRRRRPLLQPPGAL